jgi:hypothetical protein
MTEAMLCVMRGFVSARAFTQATCQLDAAIRKLDASEESAWRRTLNVDPAVGYLDLGPNFASELLRSPARTLNYSSCYGRLSVAITSLS